MFGGFRDILFFSPLNNAGFALGRLIIEVCKRFDLLALCTAFGYNAIHGKGPSFSSRRRVLAHRCGNNIYYPILYHKLALQASLRYFSCLENHLIRMPVFSVI
jgi:hypothetical protein